MGLPRKNPPAPGEYCSTTTTRYPGPCGSPAVWLVFYACDKTGEAKNANACGSHLGKLLAELTPEAEYSREMFRVLPWDVAIAEHKKRAAAEAATA